ILNYIYMKAVCLKFDSVFRLKAITYSHNYFNRKAKLCSKLITHSQPEETSFFVGEGRHSSRSIFLHSSKLRIQDVFGCEVYSQISAQFGFQDKIKCSHTFV